jgi:hypothetical protein
MAEINFVGFGKSEKNILAEVVAGVVVFFSGISQTDEKFHESSIEHKVRLILFDIF